MIKSSTKPSDRHVKLNDHGENVAIIGIVGGSYIIFKRIKLKPLYYIENNL